MNSQRRRGNKYASKNKSTINPNHLIKVATPVEKRTYQPSMNFDDFDLHPNLRRNLRTKGYSQPTEIQEKSIQKLIDGHDLIGVANTGTGKTGAFLIPMIEQMLTESNISSLVIVPTRELAQQVQEEFKSLVKGLNLTSACYIGGGSVQKDIKTARKRNNLIVGTPGRICDLINRGALNLSITSTFVLDEFDRMLDMGFIRDIKKIEGTLLNKRQTLLFSATIDKTQDKLIKEFVKEPIKINVSNGTSSSNNVHQDIIKISDKQSKFEKLCELLIDSSLSKAILFAETKRTADKLTKQLRQSGHKSDVIHGNKSQNYRSNAIRAFKTGKTKILVATDVAARGLDIDDISHVINYQIPQTMDSYIHRIGRTGRAGRIGHAFTFVN